MRQETINLAAAGGKEAFQRDLGGQVLPDLGPQKGPASVTLWLPKLPRATHPNARSHWRAKATATKSQRTAAYFEAKEVQGKREHRWTLARIDITYYTIAPLVDRQNLIGWLKASCDGLQDAGLIVNDSGFSFGPVQVERVKSNDPRKGKFKLEITEINP